MKLGGLEKSAEFGAWQIEDISVASLPQEAATAMSSINDKLLGATYSPIRYVGKQIVNGINYFFLCKQVRITKEAKKGVVGVIVNVPAGDNGTNAKVVSIIDEIELKDEIQDAFDAAIGGLVGVNYKPLIYIGSKVTKGINYYVICAARAVYPDAEPYAVLVEINSFHGKNSIVSIETIEDVVDNVNGPLGEWP